MGVYTPQSLGIASPSDGFKQGGWYSGRQYWNGTLSDPNVIHPESNQQGAGQAVSSETMSQSAQAQGTTPGAFNQYLQTQQQNSLNVAPVTPVVPTGQAGNMGGFTAGMTQTPTLDLQGLYESLYKSEGIEDLQNMINTKAEAFNTAKSKINDNPFLSEADRVGRISKLTTDFDDSIKLDRDNLAMKKADIETKIKLASKQYDINSQAAKDALSQFNSLLSMGALENISGNDIANLVRSTGLSSSMIQSAIQSQKSKNVATSTVSWDDGTNQGFAIINSDTGEIIKKQTVASSKPKSLTDADKKNNEISGAQNLINLYGLIDTKDSQWKTAHALRQQYSPEDFKKQLLIDYPMAAEYIKSIYPD